MYRYINPQTGYALVYMPDHPRSCQGMVLEHIAVIEEKLGREVTRKETVHHLNGIRSDNRPENLVAVKRSDHATWHNGRCPACGYVLGNQT